MDETKRAFWVVWNPNGCKPVCKHDSEDSATRESERLAQQHPGQMFFVLQAIALRTVDSMQRVTLVPGAVDDVPF